MTTRSRCVLALTVTLAATISMVSSGAGTAYAGNTAPTAPPASVGTNSHSVDVTVTDTSVTGGSPGSGTTGGSSGSANTGGAPGAGTLSVTPPCWMRAFATGKEYYQAVQSGTGVLLDTYIQTTPMRGYEQFKDDSTGHWYIPDCNLEVLPDPNDQAWAIDFMERFLAKNHSIVYYRANNPPKPTVPPQVLREIAIKRLTPPSPELNWNPRRTGNAGTLVNLETWFWLNNSTTPMTVSATAGANEASVTATFGGMEISAPGEKPVTCDGPGTPYTRGAKTTCFLAFSRASSALGAARTTVTVKTTWTGRWAIGSADQGAVPSITQTDTADIRVDEIQTLVSGAR